MSERKNKKSLLLTFSFTFAILGTAGSIYGLGGPSILQGEISLAKNKNIRPKESVEVNFAYPVLLADRVKGIEVSPSEEVEVRWQAKNTRAVIVPKKSWKLETQYKLEFPAMRNVAMAKIENQEFSFSTVPAPKIKSVAPLDGAKDVVLGIEDPIKITFEKVSSDFVAKFTVNGSEDVEYQENEDENSFSFLPKSPLKEGEKQKIEVFIRNKDEDPSLGYKKIFESSFETKAPTLDKWDKDFAVRVEQAKKFTPAKLLEGKYVDINLKSQILSMFENGILLDSFLISTGKRGMDTPKGEYKIRNKSRRVWSKAYGLYMPFWMAVAADGKFGIHELPEWPSGYKEGANHLGIPVSHGCIRLGVGPAEKIWNWAEIGTPVMIY